MSMCNKCGNEAEVLHQIKIEGQYSSRELFDGRQYILWLCEPCFISLMGEMKTPPEVVDNDAINVTWADDRLLREERKLSEQNLRDSLANAKERGLCVYRVDGLCCSRDRAGTAGVDDYCEFHLLNFYVRNEHAPIWRNGASSYLLWEARVQIGKHFLESFRAGVFLEPANEDAKVIFISTLFSLAVEPESSPSACKLLARITGKDPPTNVYDWVNFRVPQLFRPGDFSAPIANAWLAWGQAAGYGEAVAHASLAYKAEAIWEKGEDPGPTVYE